MKQTILLFFAVLTSSISYAQNNFYVSITGSNSNNGEISTPWKTIQYGVSQLNPGDTLNIMAGTYDGKIDLSTSGTTGNKITIRNYNNDNVVILGAGLPNYEYLLKIENIDNINISGLKFQDYQKLDARGILVINSSGISILNNEFYNIDYSATAIGETPNSSQNSQPIIVYGRDSLHPVSNLKINGNTIHDCETGWSECLSINGNIESFEVLNNHIYNNTNIPIVAIGHEGECPDPALDQARNGLIKNNLIHNNPSAYAAAGGIYIDGAKSFIIEKNTSYNNDYGIEIGCENNGNAPNDPSASEIIVRNNVIYNNKISGIALGGYNYPTSGKVKKTTIRNNTLFNNDTNNTYSGELLISYVENSNIENNIFFTNNTHKVLIISSEANPTLLLDYNLYYSPSGGDDIVIEINGTEYNEFSSFQSATSQDSHSSFSNPLFVNAVLPNPDLHLSSTSPAIDSGNPSFIASTNETDIDGEIRIYNGIVDCGADEFGSVSGIEGNEIMNWLLFPNPTEGKIFIKGISDFNYRVYSHSGQLIKTTSDYKNGIDLSNLSKGLYLIEVLDKKGGNHFKIKSNKKITRTIKENIYGLFTA